MSPLRGGFFLGGVTLFLGIITTYASTTVPPDFYNYLSADQVPLWVIVTAALSVFAFIVAYATEKLNARA